jgi:hypothetical protein
MSKNISLIIFVLFCCTYFSKQSVKIDFNKENVFYSQKTFYKNENIKSLFIFDNNVVDDK